MLSEVGREDLEAGGRRKERLHWDCPCRGVGRREAGKRDKIAGGGWMFDFFPFFFSFSFAALCSLWDLSSPTRDRTQTLSSEKAQS